jgi:polysaccharide deacetylase family protein (PEP-CTERM system associated)
MPPILHAFSIDVEDWYQSSYDSKAPISDICVQNTRRVLDFLQLLKVQGTFFIQGLVAKQYPNLIREIHERGHEIQSHGFSHRPVNRMSPPEFKWELKETSKRLEDISGKSVTGFRAPDFSIDKETFWAFEVMIECGIQYDSSVFPLRTTRYGINGFERGYRLIKTPSGAIEELPVSVFEMKRLRRVRIPVGGGGYFRLLPAWFISYCLRHLEHEGLPFIIYCHPYEFNPEEWHQILIDIPVYRRFHQGIGRKQFGQKVANLLKTGNFGTMSDVLKRLRKEETQIGCGLSL